MSAESLTPAYFERLYEARADPWDFATSPYERAKYDDSLAALDAHYGAILEIGCSIGVLSRDLALRCDRLLAVDVSERALEAARERCVDRPQARFARMTIPDAFPPGRFDAIVVSEVAYYWSDADVARARTAIAQALVRGGHLLLVHFLPEVADYVRDGDAVHAIFLADPRFAHVHGHRAERYRLDLLART